MSEIKTKMFQTLDSNSIISLIILKGNLPNVLKKGTFLFIKYLIVTNGGDYPNRNSPRQEQPRGQLSQEEIFRMQLSGAGTIVRRVIVWGVNILGWNCPGVIVLGGNCPRAFVWVQLSEGQFSGGGEIVLFRITLPHIRKNCFF